MVFLLAALTLVPGLSIGLTALTGSVLPGAVTAGAFTGAWLTWRRAVSAR